MICIAHLSDLHFGRADPDLRAPLLEAVNGARPDVVAISGDLTQRARSAQFREASAFIDEIEAPVVIVPGNHDIPLDRPLSRLIAPFAGYRRHISLDLQPKFVSDKVTVAGINTVTRFAWQSGHVKRRALKRLCTVFGGDPERLNVVVAHHPLEQAPEVRKSPTRGAHAAIDTLSGCGADILLTGHLHTWHAGPIITRPEGGRILQIHAGTGLSTRLRGEENDFALLKVDKPDLTLERWVAGPDRLRFAPVDVRYFRQEPTGWTDATPRTASRAAR